MKAVLNPLTKNTERILLFFIALISFIILSTTPAIHSPDTSSYLQAMMYRFPGYVIFVKTIQNIFGNYSDIMIVMIQLLFGFLSVYVFYNNICKYLDINHLILKLSLVIALLIPFYTPLYVANNICSEGLSYPLYLLFVSFSIVFLKNNNNKSLIYLSITYVLLTLTRGQFLFAPIILGCVYFFKYKKTILNKPKLFTLLLLLMLPLVSSNLDKAYHKFKDGHYVSTPFGYINLLTSPFYISQASDAKLIDNEDHKTIFIKSYKHLYKNSMLAENHKGNSYKEQYLFLHENLPIICNQTIYTFSTDYYLEKGLTPVQANIKTEKTCESLFFILLKDNLQSWFLLYWENLSYGFGSVFLLVLVILLFCFSFIKLLFSKNQTYLTVFFFLALTLSNAIIVAMVTYSIQRLLLYNYSLMLLILILFAKIICNKKTL